MFTWKPIYTELATTLLAWRSRQHALIAILHAAKDKGVPVDPVLQKQLLAMRDEQNLMQHRFSFE